MRIIIKNYPEEKFWSTIFCVGTNACEAGGFISNLVFQKMLEENKITEIDSVEIIELFFRHVPLISEVQKCKYYEIKKVELGAMFPG